MSKPPEPKPMQIVGGEISMADGSDLQDYLKSWMEHYGHQDGTAVRLMTAEECQDLCFAASFFGVG